MKELAPYIGLVLQVIMLAVFLGRWGGSKDAVAAATTEDLDDKADGKDLTTLERRVEGLERKHDDEHGKRGRQIENLNAMVGRVEGRCIRLETKVDALRETVDDIKPRVGLGRFPPGGAGT